MSQDCDQRYEESFNSFLAGVLLTRNCINNFEFFNLMNRFETVYNVAIISVESEFCVPIYFDDNKIKLHDSIDDIIFINGKKVVIKDYLYSIATPRVRDFFKIPDLKNIIVKRPKSLVKLLCKTRNKAVI